ncbi:MAG TPA: hypothetical protein VMU16_00085 [Candidatus Binataceae bacterium]|nr:hypothetical protein [Candidatus Binataceae bacterium]
MKEPLGKTCPERSRRIRFAPIAIVGAIAFAMLAFAAQADSHSKPSAPAAFRKSPPVAPRVSMAKLPMRFEENRGQTDSRVKFLSRGNG